MGGERRIERYVMYVCYITQSPKIVIHCPDPALLLQKPSWLEGYISELVLVLYMVGSYGNVMGRREETERKGEKMGGLLKKKKRS